MYNHEPYFSHDSKKVYIAINKYKFEYKSLFYKDINDPHWISEGLSAFKTKRAVWF